MPGTLAGAKKSKHKLITLYGKDYFSRIGVMGGSVSGIKKGFALMTPEKRSAAGQKGGSVSGYQRTKKTKPGN